MTAAYSNGLVIEYKKSTEPQTCSRCDELTRVSYIEIDEEFVMIQAKGITRIACMDCWAKLSQEALR